MLLLGKMSEDMRGVWVVLTRRDGSKDYAANALI